MSIYDLVSGNPCDMFVPPDIGVKPPWHGVFVQPPTYTQPLPPTPQDSVVPLAPMISARDAYHLTKPGRRFFADMLSPTVKHV